jgi:hypothetical protein
MRNWLINKLGGYSQEQFQVMKDNRDGFRERYREMLQKFQDGDRLVVEIVTHPLVPKETAYQMFNFLKKGKRNKKN